MLLQQLLWCSQPRHVKAQPRVDLANVNRLPGVREVTAVPGYNEITTVPGRKRKMQRIFRRICRHQLVGQVRLHDSSQLWDKRERRERLKQTQSRRYAITVSSRELIQNDRARDELVPPPCICPPRPRDLPPLNHRGGVAKVVIETRNRRLDVHAWLWHGGEAISLPTSRVSLRANTANGDTPLLRRWRKKRDFRIQESADACTCCTASARGTFVLKVLRGAAVRSAQRDCQTSTANPGT
jgi:hypothetical protein